jgi:hypothetical protein
MGHAWIAGRGTSATAGEGGVVGGPGEVELVASDADAAGIWARDAGFPDAEAPQPEASARALAAAPSRHVIGRFVILRA